jgi:hypothetical protein
LVDAFFDHFPTSSSNFGCNIERQYVSVKKRIIPEKVKGGEANTLK